MIRTKIEVKDMACGMCESHVNEAVRNAFDVKSVKSSHTKSMTEITSQEPLDEDKLMEVIAATGYTPGNITVEQVEKRGLFGRK